MSEWAQAKQILRGNLGLHVIQFPSGKWGYVGTVPADIYYEDGATQEQIDNARKFGARFGPKTRVLDTKEAAVALAQSKGYAVIED